MPSRPGSPLPHATQFRMSEVQYRHLAVLADLNDCTMSEALRSIIEADIDRADDLVDDETGQPVSHYRSILKVGDFSGALEQLRSEGRAS